MLEPTDVRTLIEGIMDLRRQHCRMLARLTALEAVMLEALPENEQAEVHARVDQLASDFHQGILEEYEKHSPKIAAWLDDRKLDELL